MKQILVDEKYKAEKKEITHSIFSILRDNNLLTLSTIQGNCPYSCSAYYIFDKNMNLYIWTEEKSTHSKNIKINSKVAVNIADTSQKMGANLKGLQMLGRAKIVSGTELIKAGTLYLKRFPNISKYIKEVKDFVSDEFESAIYKIEIEKIKVLDEESFGKEGYRFVSIKI